MATTVIIRRIWPNARHIWPSTLSFGSLFHWRRREGCQRCSRMICDGQDRTPAVGGVAVMIAVEEPGPHFSKIACADCLTAQHTGGFLGGRPGIHQYELHVAPPSAKQNTVSDGLKALGGGAQR